MELTISIFLGVFFAKVADDVLIVLITKRIRNRAAVKQQAGYADIMRRVSALHETERASAAKAKGV